MALPPAARACIRDEDYLSAAHWDSGQRSSTRRPVHASACIRALESTCAGRSSLLPCRPGGRETSASGPAGCRLQAEVSPPGGADRGAVGVGGSVSRRSAGSHTAGPGTSSGQETVGQLRSAHAHRPARLRGLVVVLARLGLRAGEVVAIELDDIDRRAGLLLVSGKGSRLDVLPLPVTRPMTRRCAANWLGSRGTRRRPPWLPQLTDLAYASTLVTL
jgi:hypothetical protein